ncbi:MAG: C10 family peptidase, partial [Muribaculaceae bacterium]|nr:C10 family peptidase [Muribaculaceae bacterium]
IIIVMISFAMFACSSEENFIPQNRTEELSHSNYKISPEEAVSLLSEFLSAKDDYSLSRSMFVPKKHTVLSVEPIRNSISKTRAGSESESDWAQQMDTLLYVVNFENNMGYAIVAADKRTEPVIALVDNGSFSIDELQEGADEGLLSFIDDAIQMEMKDITEYNQQPDSRTLVSNGYTISSYYQPILHTRWAQDDVYGKYCPNKIAGCAIIAAAQILSHFKCLAQVSWSYNGVGGSSVLHWDRIIADCDQNRGRLIYSDCASSADEVAHLVRYLGSAFDADYKKESTATGESKAIDWFNKWSGLKASKLKDYNETEIVSAIKAGNPVYGRGNAGKKKVLGIRVGWKDGHAWVFDGMMVASKDGKTSTLVHCNWGFGGRNDGYYISKAFDTNAGAVIYDNEGDYQWGDTGNYRYHLQYSIITR